MQNLRFQRIELGLSQFELSAAAQVPRYKIQLAERGITCLSQAEAYRILAKLGIKEEGLPSWMQPLIEEEDV